MNVIEPEREFLKLNHSEAVQEVYKYTPQVRDYDRFMHCGVRWLPYTMYFHEKNFVSVAINTDSLGFRYAYCKGQRYSVSEMPDGNAVNLLVGGSTALGVGACSDRTTVASLLSEATGEVWLNFSARGYNATQEVIMFLMHQHKFSRINRVVVFSGMNTLALEGISEEFSSDHGRYYYSFEFQHYMKGFNEDMKRQKNHFRNSTSSILKRLKFWNNKDKNPADKIIDDANVVLSDRIERAADNIAKALKQWKQLLSDHEVTPTFVLQPLSYWCEKPMTQDERGVFHAIDSCPNNFYRLFQHVLGKDVHEPFFSAICKKTKGTNCHDMNTMLRSSPMISETIFVDRVHFNDAGNAEVARLLTSVIL